MRIAIISDIHANFEAVQAFRETYDELWVVGDLVNYGPAPGAVVDWVRQHASRAIRGNHDHAIGFDTDPRCSIPYQAMAAETGRYTASVLTDEQKSYLRSLPLSIERVLNGQRVCLFHAIPSDPLFGYLPAESDRWVEELEVSGADLLIVGHTHTPFIRQFGPKTVLNPGSLGQPKTGNPDACYAVWQDGNVELKTYPYSYERTVEAIRSLPICTSIQDQLVHVLVTGGELMKVGGH